MKPLTMSRNRLVNAVCDAFGGLSTRREFRARAIELVAAYEAETREVCVKVTNNRTGETDTRRIDIRGVTPTDANVSLLLTWGAWLYAKGWDPTEVTPAVTVTRSQPHTPFIHPMTKVKK